MKKLKLNLDQLEVATFATDAEGGGNGTVEGYYISQYCATDGFTCNGPAGGSCGGGQGQSCAWTMCHLDGCYGSPLCGSGGTGTDTGPVYTGPLYPTCPGAGC